MANIETIQTSKAAPLRKNFHVDAQRVASIILGGGQGTRLFPLTLTRCKPAILFGGRYRLIDVPVSNAIHSGIYKIFVLTQFLSSSLHQHISRTYQFDRFSGGHIALLSAEQKPSHASWFLGTADAVRQNLNYFLETPADYFLILSGDQLYHLDFRDMLAHAMETNADLTIAALPIAQKEACRMGVLQVSTDSEVVKFIEKPKQIEQLKEYASPAEALHRCNISHDEDSCFLGSMGIYLFKRKALIELLAEDSREDFGQHLIPTQIQKGNVFAFLYGGHWEDIGTIESFYQANLNLTEAMPLFNCYHEERPLFHQCQSLPGARVQDCHVTDSIICEGSVVEAEQVVHSLLGIRSIVKKGTHIEDSYLMGNEFYQSPLQNDTAAATSAQIGENCLIKRAIIDKNVYIGNNVQLVNKKGLQHYNGQNVYIRDGVIIVTRGAIIPDGFFL